MSDKPDQQVLPPHNAPRLRRGEPDTLEAGANVHQPNRFGATDLIALVLTLIWLGGAFVYFVYMAQPQEETTQAGTILSVLAVILPIALIWIGATVVKTGATMRAESARLQASIEAMRNAYAVQAQAAPAGLKEAVEKKLDEIATSQKQTQAAVATFASTRVAAPPPPEPAALIENRSPVLDAQPSLALGTPPEALAPALSVNDFIGALNFPDNENDSAGFQRLRRALADSNSAQLVRASQDVLTLLSQDGIYMDDLTPDRSRPALWRKFAEGQRGVEISGIGGIHDRSGLALASGRMRADPVFRDAAHHFLRQFDKTFARFAEHASDDDIIRLADTRTARAFMLLGRVAGTFD